MDEKIVKLKTPDWFRRIIIQMADDPDATFRDDNYSVYRKLEDAQGVVDGKIHQVFGQQIKSRTRVRLDPLELEWAHQHYNADLDRILITRSLAKHIWRLRTIGSPSFRVETTIYSTFIEHEGKRYALRDNQYELNVAVMSAFDVTAPSPTATLQGIRYRLVKLGFAMLISHLNAIHDVYFNLMPMIYKAIQGGKLWERMDM